MVASCSLVLPVYMLTIVISNTFGAGGGTLIARLIGKGEDDEASRVSAACIWMALGLGLAFSLTRTTTFHLLQQYHRIAVRL